MATDPSCHHELVPFKTSHVESIHWLEREHMLLIGYQALALYEQNPGWTGLCNGRFVGAGGIIRHYPGLGEGWAIAGPLVRAGHTTFFHRTIKKAMINLAPTLGVRRLQILVRAQFEVSHDWVQRLGFTREATLVRYGIKGEDMVMYVRFFD